VPPWPPRPPIATDRRLVTPLGTVNMCPPGSVKLTVTGGAACAAVAGPNAVASAAVNAHLIRFITPLLVSSSVP
jgi:hypothetical protein